MIRRLAWIAAGLALASAATTAQADSRKRVAILPIKVHVLEGGGGYLQDGVADMLASRLGRQQGVGIIRVDDPTAATTNAETAREAARKVGAQWVVFGSFTRFGEGASLDVACVNVASEGGAEARSIFVQAGTIGEIIPKLDGLAEKMAVHVRSGGQGPDPDVAAPAPGASASQIGDALSELDALRARVEALEASVFSGEVSEREFGKPSLAGNEDGP